jgi:hypothetical protein
LESTSALCAPALGYDAPVAGQSTGKRVLAIALGVIAAAALAVAAFTPKWLASPLAEDGGIGLREAGVCVKGRCEYMSNDEVVEWIEAEIARIVEYNKTAEERHMLAVPRAPWGGWPVCGLIAFIGCLIAAAGLVVAAVLGMMGRRIDWPVMPTTLGVLGLIVAMVAGCIFVATKPEGMEELGVGWSFGVFGGGVILGLASVFPLNRQIRPIDEELGAASATMSWGESRDER